MTTTHQSKRIPYGLKADVLKARRREATPEEECALFECMFTAGWKQADIGAKVDRSQSYVSSRMRSKPAPTPAAPAVVESAPTPAPVKDKPVKAAVPEVVKPAAQAPVPAPAKPTGFLIYVMGPVSESDVARVAQVLGLTRS